MARVIGIDLGTTNSVVAFVDNERPETIPNAEGSKLTPSVVLFGPNGTVVGELAKRQLLSSPGIGVRSVKRLMGKRFSEVQHQLAEFPFKVIAGSDDRAEVQLADGAIVAPEAVSAAVLGKLKQTAEDYTAQDIYQAVITVPAYFNDAQRTATKTAAEMAGLEVLRLLNEPTAAALAYGAGKQREEIIAVFDFGGGTFDLSILQLQNDIFEVLATSGDTHLGGDDLDFAIYSMVREEIIRQTDLDPANDIQAVARIHEAAEKAKRELSSVDATEISLPFIVADSKGPRHYTRGFTRADFVGLVQPILDRLVPPCQQALADAGLAPERIASVLLVGGSTRIPRVREMATQVFRHEPGKGLNPDEAISLGAALQASAMTGALTEVLLLDITPLSLGIELAGGVFKPIIPRNSTIPCDAARRFTTVVDNQTTVLVNVSQGERKIAVENRKLASFRLTGIPSMPRELAEIEVKFRIDANGILQVSAMDLTSGTQTGVVLEGYGALASDKREAERAVLSAEQASEADEAFMRFAERRTRAEYYQVQVNKIVDMLADEMAQVDLKSTKETLFRHDLALRARDEAGLSMCEITLQGMIEKYGPMLEKAVSKEAETTGFHAWDADRRPVDARRVVSTGRPPTELPGEAAPPEPLFDLEAQSQQRKAQPVKPDSKDVRKSAAPAAPPPKPLAAPAGVVVNPGQAAAPAASQDKPTARADETRELKVAANAPMRPRIVTTDELAPLIQQARERGQQPDKAVPRPPPPPPPPPPKKK